jgi:hypothetical protein
MMAQIVGDLGDPNTESITHFNLDCCSLSAAPLLLNQIALKIAASV